MMGSYEVEMSVTLLVEADSVADARYNVVRHLPTDGSLVDSDVLNVVVEEEDDLPPQMITFQLTIDDPSAFDDGEDMESLAQFLLEEIRYQVWEKHYRETSGRLNYEIGEA